MMIFYFVLLQSTFATSVRFVLLSGTEIEGSSVIQTVDSLKDAIFSAVNKYEDSSEFMAQVFWEDKPLLETRCTSHGSNIPTFQSEFKAIADTILQKDETIFTILASEPKQKYAELFASIQNKKTWEEAPQHVLEHLNNIQIIQWIHHNLRKGLLYIILISGRANNLSLMDLTLSQAENKQELLNAALLEDLDLQVLSPDAIEWLLKHGADSNIIASDLGGRDLTILEFTLLLSDICTCYPSEFHAAYSVRKLEFMIRFGGTMDPEVIDHFGIGLIHDSYLEKCQQVVQHRCKYVAQILIACDPDAPTCELYD